VSKWSGKPDVQVLSKQAKCSYFTEARGEPRSNAEKMQDPELTSKAIEAALRVHRTFGPGLLESAYRECMMCELLEMGLRVEREKPMPIIYKTLKLDHGYRMDLLIEGKLVIEIKTVEALNDVHFAQVLTYLRLGNYPYGLLINFNVALLKNGIRRIINSPRNSAPLRETPRNSSMGFIDLKDLDA
jgi:GxxExxY protein